MINIARASKPASIATDFLTVLVCKRIKRAAKLYTDAAADPDPYDAGTHFEPREIPISSLDDLAAELEGLRKIPTAMLVRGRLKPAAEIYERHIANPAERLLEGDRVRRKIVNFEAVPHRWLMLDVDENTSVRFNPRKPRASVEAWRATLPDGLRGAAMVFQFSSKQHLSRTLRGHAFVWLFEPATDQQLKPWVKAHGFDPSLCNAVQPHYVADPVFEGCEDPLGERALVRLGGHKAVLDLAEREPTRLRVVAATEAGNANDADESELPPGLNAEPTHLVLRAKCLIELIAPLWVEHRREMSLHITGGLLKAGWPSEAVRKTMRAIREEAGDDDSANNFPRQVETTIAQWLNARGTAPRSTSKYSRRFEVLDSAVTGFPALLNFDEATGKRCDGFLTVAVVDELEEIASSEGSEDPEPANDTEADNEDPFAVLGTNPGLDSARKELDWLVEGLALAPGKVSLLTAYAGRGKTPFACLAGVCVAAGVPLLGHEVRRARVLYLAHEGGRNARRKVLRTAQGLGVDARRLEREGWLTVLDARALDAAAVEAIERVAVEKEIGFVIVDTVTSALRGGDAGRNDEGYARILFDLGEISARTGCLILGLAHDAKSAVGSDLRGTSGTSAIVEAAQTVIRLEAKESDPTRMRVSCVRAPDLPFAAFGIHWVDGEGTLSQRISDGVPLFCQVDAAPTVERVTTRTTHNASLRAQKLQQIERTVIRIGETLATAAGGSCSLQELQAEAGDASKRVVNESILLMRSAGVVFRQNGLHRLAGDWIDIDTEDVPGRLGALIATDANFAHLRD